MALTSLGRSPTSQAPKLKNRCRYTFPISSPSPSLILKTVNTHKSPWSFPTGSAVSPLWAQFRSSLHRMPILHPSSTLSHFPLYNQLSKKAPRSHGSSRCPGVWPNLHPSYTLITPTCLLLPLDCSSLKLTGLSSYVCILSSTSSTVPGMWLMT